MDSLRAVVVAGPGYLPFYYFPPEDVRSDLLRPSDHRSDSSRLGEATHWALEIAGKAHRQRGVELSRSVAGRRPN